MFLDNGANDLEINESKKNGIIIIENSNDSDNITAINYAHSVNSEIQIIERPDISQEEIVDYLYNWKQSKEIKYFYDLSSRIYPSIEKINFTKYAFATFFTSGIPYSLIVENIIPFTYVPEMHPDLFIFNAIKFEHTNRLFASIVFSPLEFADEETEFVIKQLKDKLYYVKELVNKEATSFNIDMHVREFPFNILHFCSHGGEVKGASVKVDFKDDEGNNHIIEYDEVVSFAPEPGNPLILVTTKQIFRKLDGFIWRSKELKAFQDKKQVFYQLFYAANLFSSTYGVPLFIVANILDTILFRMILSATILGFPSSTLF